MALIRAGQTIHSHWEWTKIQAGLWPDRFAEPEVKPGSKTLQKCQEREQQVIPLQLQTSTSCSWRCAKHVLRLCIRQSRSSRWTQTGVVQRNSGDRHPIRFGIHVGLGVILLIISDRHYNKWPLSEPHIYSESVSSSKIANFTINLCPHPWKNPYHISSNHVPHKCTHTCINTQRENETYK